MVVNWGVNWLDEVLELVWGTVKTRSVSYARELLLGEYEEQDAEIETPLGRT